MPSKDKPTPAEIQVEIGKLLSQLSKAGWTILASQYDPKVFGNWFVNVYRDGITIRLVKDRSQYFVDRLSSEKIKADELSVAFSNLQEFQDAVIKWIRTVFEV
jgi:hypothetical protein